MYNVSKKIKGSDYMNGGSFATKRMNIIISEELHRSLKVEAAKSGITLTQFVAEAIAEKIQRQKGDNN